MARDYTLDFLTVHYHPRLLLRHQTALRSVELGPQVVGLAFIEEAYPGGALVLRLLVQLVAAADL